MLPHCKGARRMAFLSAGSADARMSLVPLPVSSRDSTLTVLLVHLSQPRERLTGTSSNLNLGCGPLQAAKVVSSAASLRQDSPTLHPAAGPLHPAANHPSCAMDTCDIMHQQASVHHQPAVSQRLAMVGDSNCGSQQPPAHNDISMGNESIPQHASARQCPPVSQPAAAVCFQGYPSMDDGRRLQLPLEAADAAAPMQDDATCCIDRSEQLSHNLPHPPRSCADPVVDGPSHQPFHTMQQDATDSVPAMKSHQDAVDSMPDTESHQDAAPCTPLAGRRRLIHSQASRVLDSGPASCGSNLKPCPKQCTHGEGAFASSSCKDGSDAGPGRDLTLPILMRSSKKVGGWSPAMLTLEFSWTGLDFSWCLLHGPAGQAGSTQGQIRA